MSSWEQMLDELGTDASLRDFNDAQVEAVIDVLCLIVHADRRVTTLERNELEDQLRELPWMAAKAALTESYLEKAMEQAKDGNDDAVFERIAKRAAGAISDAGARRKVLRMAATLAQADLELHARERQATLHLADAFEIPAAEAKQIIADAG